jgi:NitT/TauT family transport system ATP-binding protein
MDSVRVSDLRVSYKAGQGEVEALAGLSFSVQPGETCAIIGPSGCGKSTLLYCLAGLVKACSGRVEFNGTPLTGERRETAVILQDYGLFPWKTVRANTILGLRLRRTSRDSANAETEKILRAFGIWDYRNHYPSQISGGQRQRVAIARALTLRPTLLLMDEPFSSLDALTREDLQNVFLDVWRRDRLTTFFVTHSIEEAAFLGHKIMVLSKRPASIVSIIDNPRMGDSDYRESQGFLETCSGVRELLTQARYDVA